MEPYFKVLPIFYKYYSSLCFQNPY